jgi:hypothetical protein
MRLSLFILFLAMTSVVVGQKRLSEGALVFSVITTKQGLLVGDTLIAQHYFKGAHTRTELTGKISKSITLYDSREGLGAIVREFGSQKILIPLDTSSWSDKNAWYKASSISYSTDEQKLLGYACKKASIKLLEGGQLEIWYTPEVVLDNIDTEFQMGDIPGLVLSYEYIIDETRVIYIARSLNFDPVPIQKFEIPNAGYRILSYAESKKQF